MNWRKKAYGAGLGYAVAGPAGAVIGAMAAGNDADDRGFDMSDVPVGVHVEAEFDDDGEGRQWTLRFLSALPTGCFAELRLLTDVGQKLLGRKPFVDDEGYFAANAPIRKARSTLYVPFEAIEYDSPKHISLEVSVWHGRQNSAGQTSAAMLGKAVLDAELPKRS